MMAIGPKAAMLPEERRQIEPPLGRILARLSPQAATLVATFADPLMLGVGIVAYVTRVTRQDGPKSPPAARTAPLTVTPTQQPSTPASAVTVNGAGGPTIAAPLDNRDAGLFAEGSS